MVLRVVDGVAGGDTSGDVGDKGGDTNKDVGDDGGVGENTGAGTCNRDTARFLPCEFSGSIHT